MEYKPAGFWIRFLATLIDSFIIAIVGLGLSFIFQDPPGDLENSVSANIFSLIYSVVCIIYLTASKFKGSPGKIFLGLQVVTVNKEKIGIGRSIGRFFAYILSGLLFLIGYIMAGFTEEKKALHDMICGTRVVYRK